MLRISEWIRHGVVCVGVRVERSRRNTLQDPSTRSRRRLNYLHLQPSQFITYADIIFVILDNLTERPLPSPRTHLAPLSFPPHRTASALPAHMLAGIRWKRPIVLIPSVVVLLITSYHWLLSPRLPHSWFSYATRPVWDRDPAPTERILQYSAEGVGAEQLCELHGFKRRNEPVQIWDAVSQGRICKQDWHLWHLS